MAGWGAILVIATVLFAAPLVLGTHIVVRGASPRLRRAWFGFLTALFVLALVAGALSLFTLPP